MGKSKTDPSKKSRVGQLNDSCFAEAFECLRVLCQEFIDELDDRPHLTEVAEILAEAVRSLPEELIDIQPSHELKELKPVLQKRRVKRRRYQPGDVCVFPHPRGHCFGVFVAKDQLGSVFVFLEGTSATATAPRAVKVIPYPRLILILNEFPAVVGQLPEVAVKFENAPRCFRSPRNFPDDPSIGKHGSVVTADNLVKYLTKRDACLLGIEDGSFIQFMTVENVAAFVDHFAKAKSKIRK